MCKREVGQGPRLFVGSLDPRRSSDVTCSSHVLSLDNTFSSAHQVVLVGHGFLKSTMKGCNTYSPSSSIEKQLSCVKGTHMRTAAWKREEDRSLERRSYVARQDFVVAYSRCGLTMENDKLITLAGIAQDVTAVTGNDFACGPSENHFLEEPLWRREPHIRPKRQLFPRVRTPN